MYQKAKKEKEAIEAERAKFEKKAKALKRGERPPTPEVFRVPEDIRLDPKYEGQTIFMMEGVPLRSIDGVTPVDTTSLRDWIIFALVEDDPMTQPYNNRMDRIIRELDEIDAIIGKIPTLLFLDEKQKPYAPERARAERAVMFTKFNLERLKKEEEGEMLQRELEAHIKWRKSMGVELTQGESDKNTDTCVWFIRLYGTSDAKEMEDMLIRKRDWPGIKLALGIHNANPPIPSWISRDKYPPDGTKLSDPTDYRPRQVAMAAVRVSRVPAGVGLFKQIDRPSAKIYADEFGLYYGQFDAGKKHGYGVEIDDVGIFSGNYEYGRKDGRGRLDLCDGTTIVGRFGVKLQRTTVPESAMFVNPYKEGFPHGIMEINFADGGLFRGSMENGRVTGHGDYQSAMNEVQSGPFVDGVLHGEKCFVENQVGEVYMGNYKHGSIDGYVDYHNARGDSYSGFYLNGSRHGYGVSQLNKAGSHRGYYTNGLKHGKGSIEYGIGLNKLLKQRMKVKREAELKLKSETIKQDGNPKAAGRSGDPKAVGDYEEETPLEATEFSEFDYMYQGYLIANSVCNNGSLINTIMQVPSLFSRFDQKLTYGVSKLLKKEIVRQKLLDDKLEKMIDVEGLIRDEIQRKKIRIYNQQKHFTKKTMYAHDQGGGSSSVMMQSQLTSKLYLRKERLKNIDVENHPFTKAMVPRLRVPKLESNDTLLRAFERIRPDENEVSPDQMVNERLLQVLLSDFEEVQERQRFLKYDRIWQRAEDAYLKNRTAAV